MRKIIYFLFLLLGSHLAMEAQGSDAKVASILLSSDFVYLEHITDTVPHDTVNMRLIIACSLPSSLSKVYVKIGTDKDLGDILNEEFVVSLSSGQYGFTTKTMYYLNDGTNSGFNAFNAFDMGYGGFDLTANQATYKSIKWITVYALDHHKRKTNIRYYHIN